MHNDNHESHQEAEVRTVAEVAAALEVAVREAEAQGRYAEAATLAERAHYQRLAALRELMRAA